MEPFDYIGWVKRAQDFVGALPSRLEGEVEINVEVELPVPDQDVFTIESKLKRNIPQELKNLLTTGSGHCQCRYVWDDLSPTTTSLMKEIFPYQGYLYGGLTLESLFEYQRLLESCKDWAGDAWLSEEDFEKNRWLWLNSLPIISIANGDYIALDWSENQPDPPVVYLSHDDESHIISPSFTHFLSEWEQLCYIGPEIWLLEEFLNEETGYLESNSEKGHKIRQLFGGGFKT
jgi:hypothetical protein